MDFFVHSEEYFQRVRLRGRPPPAQAHEPWYWFPSPSKPFHVFSVALEARTGALFATVRRMVQGTRAGKVRWGVPDRGVRAEPRGEALAVLRTRVRGSGAPDAHIRNAPSRGCGAWTCRTRPRAAGRRGEMPATPPPR